MKTGDLVEVLNHPKATAWHREVVGRITRIVRVGVHNTSYGPYHCIEIFGDDIRRGIAEICLRPVKDGAEFESFMRKVCEPITEIA